MARAPRTSYDSGSKSNLGPQAPVLTDAAATSRDAQRIIMRNQNKLSNPFGEVNVPAPVNRQASHPYGQPASSLLPAKAGAQNKSGIFSDDEMMRIAGYEPKATKSNNPVISGYPGGRKRR